MHVTYVTHYRVIAGYKAHPRVTLVSLNLSIDDHWKKLFFQVSEYFFILPTTYSPVSLWKLPEKSFLLASPLQYTMNAIIEFLIYLIYMPLNVQRLSYLSQFVPKICHVPKPAPQLIVIVLIYVCLTYNLLVSLSQTSKFSMNSRIPLKMPNPSGLERGYLDID